MNTILNYTIRFTEIPISSVKVPKRLRKITHSHVLNLAHSFKDTGGQLVPIILTPDLVLIDGAHRLEAAKHAGIDALWAGVLDTNISETERQVLEVESNRLRRELTVLERKHYWDTIIEPWLTEKAKARQAKAGAENMRRHHEIMSATNLVELTEPTTENIEPTKSKAQLAQEYVQLSPDTIRKIDQIQAVIHAENAPEELQRAALKALDDINQTGLVDPAFKALRRAEARMRDAKMTADEQRQRALETMLHTTLDQANIFLQRLKSQYPEALLEAGLVSPQMADVLFSTRVALKDALLLLVDVNAQVQGVPESQVMQMTINELRRGVRNA